MAGDLDIREHVICFWFECLEQFESILCSLPGLPPGQPLRGFPPDKQTMMRGVRPYSTREIFFLSIRTTRHSHMKMLVGRKCLFESITSLTFDVVANYICNPCCSLTGHSPVGKRPRWLPRHKVLLR